MITRFAPSPTGPLHLGHAYAAFTVWQVAADLGGTALLRIEDTDSTRARPTHEAAIYDDLAWLGLSWPQPVLRQSDHGDAYRSVLAQFAVQGLIYPCSCTRRDVVTAGGQHGIDGMVYPGTCQRRYMDSARAGDALRLDLARAVALCPATLRYTEQGQGWQNFAPATLLKTMGDPVLQRKGTGDPAYHLACVYDDGRQNITHVVRGQDIAPLTPLHVVLQHLLGLPTPVYHHHPLITDAAGKRLAKIDKSKALAKYRAEGASVADVKKMIGWAD